VTTQGQIAGDVGGDVEPWEPRRIIRAMEPREARLANGFLRCHPERWLPGFPERWAPLLSVLGCELRVSEVKPTIVLPDDSWLCFKGTFENEGLVVAVEPHTAQVLADEIVPHVRSGLHSDLIIEYLIQRFMAVLGMSQTVSESAGGLVYNGRCAPGDMPAVASVRLSFSLNSAPCSVVVALGQELLERMDRLWRRQVHSSARSQAEGSTLRFELAQLGVPPNLLAEYVTKGTVIDLEVPVSDAITLRIGSKVFMPARMVDIDGMLGCQTVQGVAPTISVVEGASRLSIEIFSMLADPNALAELAQVGAVLNTGRPIGDRVVLSINQERVAEARLSVYQGRYAVEVL